MLLVCDGAPAPRATVLKVPARISLISLPASTPELKPSKRGWPLVKEGVAHRAHESVDECEQGSLFTLSKDQCRRNLGADKLSLVARAMNHLSFHCNLVLVEFYQIKRIEREVTARHRTMGTVPSPAQMQM